MSKADKVVIVTGAAKGIGRAYALGFAGEGWNVVLADLADASETAAEVDAAGAASSLSVPVDVSDPVATEAMAAAALERHGRIDALINNAGYFTAIRKKPMEELTVEEWDLCQAINVKGTWLCAKAVLPTMKAQGEGRIINTSSMTVPSGVPGFLHYVASKAAIIGLTRALAREVGGDNIAVNTISPDYIPHDSEYASQQPQEAEMLRNMRCFKRESVPQDLVGTVLFLCGPGADFVTGQNLYVNGGRLFS
jgi:3-oxoacyl-[acyl-carrier protein] reductase